MLRLACVRAPTLGRKERKTHVEAGSFSQMLPQSAEERRPPAITCSPHSHLPAIRVEFSSKDLTAHILTSRATGHDALDVHPRCGEWRLLSLWATEP